MPSRELEHLFWEALQGFRGHLGLAGAHLADIRSHLVAKKAANSQNIDFPTFVLCLVVDGWFIWKAIFGPSWGILGLSGATLGRLEITTGHLGQR